MRSYQKKFVNFFIFLFLITLLGCVEEPTMEELQRPYTSLRIGNFTYNTPIKVIIDGTERFELQVNTMSEFFDIESGGRNFAIVSVDDTIYRGNVKIPSYEEVSLYFFGYVDDSTNSIQNYLFSEGETFIHEAPKSSDTSWVNYFNFAPDIPASTQGDLEVKSSADSDTSLITVAFGEHLGFAAKQGDHNVLVIKDFDPTPLDSVIVNQQIIYDGGMINSVFIIGNPNAPGLVKESHVPLPVRPK